MSAGSDFLGWPENLIVSLVVGGFVLFIVIRIIISRVRGDVTDPLPRLDYVARDAAVVAVHRDQQLIEVEYTDAAGRVRRECLADVIPTGGLDRFSVGTAWRVYGFVAPHARLMKDPAEGDPAAGRCLLTEEHDDIARAGVDLDGLRATHERWMWSAPRVGSPFLGVMSFVTDGSRWMGEVIGQRDSFPGGVHDTWARASRGYLRPMVRPHDVPRPESVAEVAGWEDPNGFGRTELYHAPIFWVCLPLAALGFLIWGIITDPGDGWSADPFGGSGSRLWNGWFVWVAVAVWLLIMIGVLLVNIAAAAEVRADNAWIFAYGIPYSIHISPYRSTGGEGESWPTFIGIDHRLPDKKAFVVHQALHDWLSQSEVQTELESGSLSRRSVISAQELFGDDAEGGYYIESIPGFGSDDHFAAHRWVLITEPRDPASEDGPTVTTVPLEEKREKIRRRLRVKHPTNAGG